MSGDKLLQAAKEGDISTLVALLQSSPPTFANQALPHGTALHHAALGGHFQCLLHLLDDGADTEAKNHDGRTPLHLASNGHPDCLKALLSKGAHRDPRDTVDGSTPLHIAARTGHAECVRVLLEAGADRHAVDDSQWGETPLHCASSAGHAPCVRLLLGPYPAWRETRTTVGFMTPLHLAAYNGRVEALKLLIEAGAKKEAKNREGMTPLLLSAERGHAECVKALVAAGSFTRARDGIYFMTALHHAVLGGHRSCVKALSIASGPAAIYIDRFMRTPMHYAARWGRVRCLDMLLHNGLSLDHSRGDVSGKTPLHLAVQHEHAECVEQLLYEGANKEAVDMAGDTPLKIALRSDSDHHPAAVLLAYGAAPTPAASIDEHTLSDALRLSAALEASLGPPAVAAAQARLSASLSHPAPAGGASSSSSSFRGSSAAVTGDQAHLRFRRLLDDRWVACLQAAALASPCNHYVGSSAAEAAAGAEGLAGAEPVSTSAEAEALTDTEAEAEAEGEGRRAGTQEREHQAQAVRTPKAVGLFACSRAVRAFAEDAERDAAERSVAQLEAFLRPFLQSSKALSRGGGGGGVRCGCARGPSTPPAAVSDKERGVDFAGEVEAGAAAAATDADRALAAAAVCAGRWGQIVAVRVQAEVTDAAGEVALERARFAAASTTTTLRRLLMARTGTAE